MRTHRYFDSETHLILSKFQTTEHQHLLIVRGNLPPPSPSVVLHHLPAAPFPLLERVHTHLSFSTLPSLSSSTFCARPLSPSKEDRICRRKIKCGVTNYREYASSSSSSSTTSPSPIPTTISPEASVPTSGNAAEPSPRTHSLEAVASQFMSNPSFPSSSSISKHSQSRQPCSSSLPAFPPCPPHSPSHHTLEIQHGLPASSKVNGHGTKTESLQQKKQHKEEKKMSSPENSTPKHHHPHDKKTKKTRRRKEDVKEEPVNREYHGSQGRQLKVFISKSPMSMWNQEEVSFFLHSLGLWRLQQVFLSIFALNFSLDEFFCSYFMILVWMASHSLY
jgi:hypothetical protein